MIKERDTIVYFGIIQSDYENAMFQHAKGIKKLIVESGYNAILIGVSSNTKVGSFDILDDNYYTINYPNGIAEKMYDTLFARDIIMILNDIGLAKIESFIMADYRFFPMKTMKKYCKDNNIKFVVDVMDRFEFSGSFSSLIKKFDNDLRNMFLYKMVDRRIYISSYYYNLLGYSDHTVVIPGVVFKKYESKKRILNKKIRLVFLGKPGKKCEKEKIDWIIKSIYSNKLDDKVEFLLAGFEKNEFLSDNKHLAKYLTKSVIFKERLSHDECLELLLSSDFSVVIRPNTVLSNYGFSTKIGEAFSCGIPVIATYTSDNDKYIVNGINGFLCDCNFEDVSNVINHIAEMTREEINEMKCNVKNNDVLNYAHYLNSFYKAVIKS